MLSLKKKMFFVRVFFVLFFLVYTISLVQAATTTVCDAMNCTVTFTTSNSSWPVPAGVTQITGLVVGGGGGGSQTVSAGGGATGGALRYSSSITVVPGTNLTITVGAGGAAGATGVTGGLSKIANSSAVALAVNLTAAGGGGGQAGSAGATANNGTSTGTGGVITGGDGGAGGTAPTNSKGCGGGGGAGGWYGAGGAGGASAANGANSTGGGGGGGGGSATTLIVCGGGGGVGIVAAGNNGTGGATSTSVPGAGTNGSNGNNGTGSAGGLYGGAGGGADAAAGAGAGKDGAVVIKYDLINPSFSNYNITYITPANNSNYSSTTVYRFNSTVANTNGTAGIQFNGTNYTTSNLSSVFNTSITNLAAATYTYYWWAYGSGILKQFNITSLMSYTVAQATPILTFKANSGTSNLSLIYPQQVNISATNDSGTVGLDQDNVAYGSNGLNVSLSAGSYIFRANITGNQNYSDVGYSYYNITINKTIPQGSLTNTTSWTVTYPTQTNISYSEANTGDGDVKYNVSRDNVYKNGGENVTLGVGIYNYVLNTTGGTNYTANASMDAKTLTVEINSTYALTLTITPSTTLTYPIAINATGTNCPIELTCSLYRNDTIGAVTNGVNVTLGVGAYNITYNTTGNTNYSAKSVSQILTINRGVLQGSLTNTTSLTVTYPQQINVSYTETNTGDGDVTYQLYRDDVDVTATEKGLNVTLSAGTYSYLLNSTGGANYSSNASISNFTITINPATPVITKLLNSGTSNITIAYPQQVNATGSSTGGTIKIYRDETDVTSAENGANVSLSAGGYIYKFNVTGNTNYSSIAGEYMQVNISKATGVMNGTINGTQGNFTAINGTATQNIYINATNMTGYGTGKIYLNGSIINSGTLPLSNMTNLSIGIYNITFEYDGNTNYTSDSDVWWVNVTLVTNTCACAGLDKNWEINLADSCVIDDNCNLGTGKLNFTGSGNVTCSANINTTNLGDVGANGIMYVNSDCYLLVK